MEVEGYKMFDYVCCWVVFVYIDCWMLEKVVLIFISFYYVDGKIFCNSDDLFDVDDFYYVLNESE